MFLQIQSDVQSLFFWRGGGGGDPETDHHEARSTFWLDSSGQNPNSDLSYSTLPLNVSFQLFGKKGVGGGGGGEGIKKKNSLCDKALFHVKSYK